MYNTCSILLRNLKSDENFLVTRISFVDYGYFFVFDHFFTLRDKTKKKSRFRDKTKEKKEKTTLNT